MAHPPLRLQKDALKLKSVAEKRLLELTALKMPITIAVHANLEGKLFGSVGPAEVVRALEAQKIPIKKQEVSFPGLSGIIQDLGQYAVEIQLHPDVKADLTIDVVLDAS